MLLNLYNYNFTKSLLFNHLSTINPSWLPLRLIYHTPQDKNVVFILTLKLKCKRARYHKEAACFQCNVLFLCNADFHFSRANQKFVFAVISFFARLPCTLLVIISLNNIIHSQVAICFHIELERNALQEQANFAQVQEILLFFILFTINLRVSQYFSLVSLLHFFPFVFPKNLLKAAIFFQQQEIIVYTVKEGIQFLWNYCISSNKKLSQLLGVKQLQPMMRILSEPGGWSSPQSYFFADTVGFESQFLYQLFMDEAID